LDIKAFIRELLFSYDCVIIPGFGGFIGNYSPSRIDRTSGTFIPPVKQISFNRNLNHNDGLLVSRISQATGLNYVNSRQVVEEFVRDLTGRLEKGEQIVFDHLGTFDYNHENNVQFEPESGINYCLDSYGLESFNLGHHGDYDVRKRVVRHIDRESIRRSSVRKNLVRAAIMIPILALLVIAPLKNQLYDKARVESVTMNPLVTAEFEHNKEEIDSDLFAQAATKEEIPTPLPVSSKVVKPEETPAYNAHSEAVTPDSKFYIITGSFKSEENALVHVKELRKAGFNPEIIKASNGFYRVNAMECNNMEKALTKKDSLSGKYPGVWISKRKPI
jgi:nucleoid DNA-binding protein